MIFTTLPVDCVLEILKRVHKVDKQNLKMVNSRMKNIVHRFFPPIFEISFTETDFYLTAKANSDPICVELSLVAQLNDQEKQRISDIFKQASSIETVCFVNRKVSALSMITIHERISALGFSMDLPVKYLRLNNSNVESHDTLSKFLEFWNYQELHLDLLHYNEMIKDNFYILKNLKSLTVVTPALAYNPSDLGLYIMLRGIRQAQLEKFDLHGIEAGFACHDVVSMIKSAVDDNLKVEWNFGQIARSSEQIRQEIQSLKDNRNDIHIKIIPAFGRDIGEYYTIKSANGTFEFNAKRFKEAVV